MAEHRTEPKDEPRSTAATASTKSAEERQAEAQREALSIFSDPQLQALDQAGYTSYEDVAALSDEELLAVPGIGEGTVRSWRERVRRPKPAPSEAWPEGLSTHTCPECHLPLDMYAGANPHKQGTGWCPNHGRVSPER